jgi:hypothetical protein
MALRSALDGMEPQMAAEGRRKLQLQPQMHADSRRSFLARSSLVAPDNNKDFGNFISDGGLLVR